MKNLTDTTSSIFRGLNILVVELDETSSCAMLSCELYGKSLF